ncbi:MAG: hypothetical protein SVS85_02430, partial [Candidatus Nanohaloarchaea archaeon]|nr:hypothetical protein [Candidatus Nanohaloarchaea archaeon]
HEGVMEVDPRFYNYLESEYEGVLRRPRVSPASLGPSLVEGVPVDLESSEEEIAGVEVPYDSSLFEGDERGVEVAPDAVLIRFDDGRMGKGRDPEFDYGKEDSSSGLGAQ